MKIKPTPKTLALAAGAASSLIATRVALPYLLVPALSFALKKVPGWEGHVDGLELHLIEGSIRLRGLGFARRADHALAAAIDIDRMTVRLDWKRFLKGSLVADVTLESPRVFVDMERLRNGGPDPTPEHADDAASPNWQQRLRDLLDLRVHVTIAGGQIRAAGIPGLNGTDLRASDLHGVLENLTNSAALSGTLMARAECRARVMTTGQLVLHAKGYPLADRATFDVDAMLRGLDLREVGSVIRRYTGFVTRNGVLDLYVEAAAQDGRLQGYAKPVIERLEVARAEPGLAAAVTTAGVRTMARWLEDDKEGRLATRVDFAGTIDRPRVDMVGAFAGFVRNAFLEPFAADLEYRVRFDRAGTDAHDVRVRYEQPPKSGVREALEVVADSARRWYDDGVPRMAAALSYYTAFSLAPMLILVIAIAGFSFGRDAAQGRLMDEIGGLVGSQSAAAIQSMVKSAQRPAQGILATLISLVGLVAGASGVLSELKFALNRIFRAEERSGIRQMVKERLKLLGIILGIGFLLTVSLAISAGVAAAGKLMGGMLPIPEWVMHGVNFLISFGVITALFAMMYKFVPDVDMAWRDVWLGAGITSFLFTVGKSLLGLYLGKGAVGSSYGAAGSVLIILLWVYYSAIIFYFGAEFITAYAARDGARSTAPALRDAALRDAA